ncbi:MAG: TlpA disulfide reductase family protein [Candidatus Aminicenantes bacterium]|nr:TlpA disulfide reductase family protein [Candidatus Aminicenantes bacterium]
MKTRTKALCAVFLITASALPAAAVLKTGDPFLPFALRAVDGRNIIVTMDAGRLTLIVETTAAGKTERKTSHPSAVLLDFWATWCLPCRTGMPYMQKLHDTYRARDDRDSGGLSLFGIALDLRGSAVVKPFFQKLKFTYAMLADPVPGLSDPKLLRTAQDMGEKYDAQEIPVVYLIDTKGRIRHVHMGFKVEHFADLEKTVAGLIAEDNK